MKILNLYKRIGRTSLRYIPYEILGEYIIQVDAEDFEGLEMSSLRLRYLEDDIAMCRKLKVPVGETNEVT